MSTLLHRVFVFAVPGRLLVQAWLEGQEIETHDKPAYVSFPISWLGRYHHRATNKANT